MKSVMESAVKAKECVAIDFYGLGPHSSWVISHAVGLQNKKIRQRLDVFLRKNPEMSGGLTHRKIKVNGSRKEIVVYELTEDFHDAFINECCIRESKTAENFRLYRDGMITVVEKGEGSELPELVEKLTQAHKKDPLFNCQRTLSAIEGFVGHELASQLNFLSKSLARIEHKVLSFS